MSITEQFNIQVNDKVYMMFTLLDENLKMCVLLVNTINGIEDL
jgi:hypothetical protein